MPLRKYVVIPPLEDGLQSLREIAGNLWFSWNMDAVELFDHLDEHLWREMNHNPLQTLVRLSRQRLNEVRQDEGYLEHAERVRQKFRAYMKRTPSYDYRLEQPVNFVTAYFSLEFGITECLPIYSGGLGLLAGDHLKSASDLNLPLVAVGLMYQEGYLRQKLTSDGWQEEVYPRTEFDTLPLERQTDASGAPLVLSVDLAGEILQFKVFKVKVGRVPLFLLDTDITENSPSLRSVTARLYGGDPEMRIRQEILLGIGGCRALDALKITPAAYHLNEGHAVFVLLEKIRSLVEEEGLSLEEACQLTASQSTLTIHTPVPAGNDVFNRAIMEKYFRNFASRIGMDFETFLGLGRINPMDTSQGFHMTVLGLKMTSRTNAVSKLNSKVARDMWRQVWPNAEKEDVPIVPITNGVHIPSYISRDLVRLYDRYLGPGWTEDPDNEKIWQRAEQIPDMELWRTHERCRARLVFFVRRRMLDELRRKGASGAEQEAAEKILDPETLTICFGRRFATYKRGALLFREPERLARIFRHSNRPIQLVIAGKAHPADTGGKELIRKIVQLIKEPPFRGRIVFIEDYDINVARYMVQGADVWLNTPRRPMEACGTSGMKAAANGALNLSVLDGWWDEAYRGDNGWAIGWREEYDNPDYQDAIEGHALYEILEETVAPLFYERGADDLPRGWIDMMKRSIQTICPSFNSHRMVSEYIETSYVPAASNFVALRENNYSKLRQLVSWRRAIRADWDKIAIRSVNITNESEALQGKNVEVAVVIDTAGHNPDEFKIELLHGPVDLWDNFKDRHITRLTADISGAGPFSEVRFSGLMPLAETGLYGYVVRVRPEHPNLPVSDSFDLVERG